MIKMLESKIRYCTECGEYQDEGIMELDRDCEHCGASFEEIVLIDKK